MKTIFDFASAGEVLRFYFENEKEGLPSLTHGRFAERLELSLSLFRMILAGKRHLTVENLHQVAEKLRLNPVEHNYFEALVYWSQCPPGPGKRFYQKRLDELRERAPQARVPVASRLLTKHWFVPSVVVWLLDIHDVAKNGLKQIDVENLARNFRVPHEEMAEALEQIRDLQIIRQGTAGGVSITLDKLVHAVSTQRFIAAVAQQARAEVKEHFEKRDRYFESCTLTLTPERYESFVDALKELTGQFAADGGEGNDLRVYQSFQALWPTWAGANAPERSRNSNMGESSEDGMPMT